MAERDPKNALALAQKAGTKLWPISGIFEVWAEQDPAEAAEHILDLPAGQIRTLALRTVAEKWADNDPERALAWAQLSAGSAARAGHRAEILMMTMKKCGLYSDPETAKAWISNSAFSPELKSALLKGIHE